jgi:hypothetical protein
MKAAKTSPSFWFVLSSIPLLLTQSQSQATPEPDCYGSAAQKWLGDNVALIPRVGGAGLHHYCVTNDDENCDKFQKLVKDTDVSTIDIFLQKFVLDIAAFDHLGLVSSFSPTVEKLHLEKPLKSDVAPRFIACFPLDEDGLEDLTDHLQDLSIEGRQVAKISNFHVYFVDASSTKAVHHLYVGGTTTKSGDYVVTAQDIPLSEFFGGVHAKAMEKAGGEVVELTLAGDCHAIKLTGVEATPLASNPRASGAEL